MNIKELLDLVEKEGDYYEWKYKDINCKIIRCVDHSTYNPNRKFAGHWCGYVQIPKGHKLRRKKNYLDIDLNVHGGLSYYNDKDYWIGFDCMHLGDIRPFDLANNEYQDPDIILKTNHYWTKEQVIKETERLADQLVPVN